VPEPTPSIPSADRNLLFGVLALQMDFISHEALIAAMQTWVVHKQQPLGQILRDHQALGAEEHALLDALVNKHLAFHGDNVEESLAAVRTVGSVRRQLEQIADPDLQTTLAHLAGPPTEDEDCPATRGSSVGVPTAAGTRFVILRPHARGGLGEVFMALDEELNREVALKQIQAQYADDPDSRTRFVVEAEITGGLEHPGIVPVYGLGQYEDGRPFYAMRFIRGDSLQAAIARFHKTDWAGRDPGERTVALRQLLGRFVSVSNAVAYAHSRGVLHRDLKPGNVMLGPYGETLVVDWGLAKPFAADDDRAGSAEAPLRPSGPSGSTATQMGTVVGTPAFMSPEQAAGRPDLVGPASDIYSLGATLYALLTGKPPFGRGDVAGGLAPVQRGEFARPRQVRQDIPAALEAVCLKAMAREPGQRYATPQALAQDVEQWLADEPVSAWEEPWSVRTRRWLGRHRTLVTAAAAAVLVAVVSLAAATALLAATSERERQAERLALGRTERLALGRVQEADRNARSASEQRRLALETLQAVIFDTQRELECRPGMQDLRKRLLEKAQTGLRNVAQSAELALAEANPGSALAKGDLAVFYEWLGDVSLELGDVRAARDAYRQRLELAEALALADPDSAQAQTDLVVSCYKLGTLEERALHFGEAIRWYGRAEAILERLRAVDKLKDQPRYVSQAKDLETRLAACRSAQRAIQDIRFALTRPPSEAARLLVIRATVLARQGRHADAAASAAKLHDLAPKDAGVLYNAACCYALCVPAVARDKKPGQLTAAEKNKQEHYADRAVTVLREAVANGYKDVAHIKQDSDLDPLRARAGFQKLVAELEAKARPAAPAPLAPKQGKRRHGSTCANRARPSVGVPG
jgi:serine/threonine-protein kinase